MDVGVLVRVETVLPLCDVRDGRGASNQCSVTR